MRDALKGLYFFTRFAYSFSALGYRQQHLFWKDRPGDFRDQRWLITGASGGIGRAITLGAASHGAAGGGASIGCTPCGKPLRSGGRRLTCPRECVQTD